MSHRRKANRCTVVAVVTATRASWIAVHWLAEVGPEAWNLAWLALPNPEFEPAPSGFKTALRQESPRGG